MNNITRAREALAAAKYATLTIDPCPDETTTLALRVFLAIAGPALELAEAVDKEPFTTVRLQNALAAFLAALDRALEADRG